MKPTKTLITLGIAALIIVSLFIMPAAAADDTPHKTLGQIISDWCKSWDGWTYDKSTHTRLTSSWIADVKEHIKTLITDKRASFTDRAKAQAYALGWDDRFDYIEKYGMIDYETGKITYDVPFWDGLFGGLKFREKWFTNLDDYNEAMSVYMENYNNAVEPVPQVV